MFSITTYITHHVKADKNNKLCRWSVISPPNLISQAATTFTIPATITITAGLTTFTTFTTFTIFTIPTLFALCAVRTILTFITVLTIYTIMAVICRAVLTI